MPAHHFNESQIASWALRLGLGFVFAYAAFAAFFDPYTWAGYLPHFLFAIIDPVLAIRAVAAYQLVLAAWLVSGKYSRYAGILSVLTLVGILATNLNQLVVTFRDVGLICAAIALAVLSKRPANKL